MSDSSSITERLAAYAPKAAAPVLGLLKAKLVDEGAVGAAMDAVELAGRPERLASFVTAVLYLRSQGVDVRDVVAMASKHGRKVRLDWSPRRWKEEHDKLARLETLQKLAAQNTRYDIHRFEKALPARFAGYLIRTSRRLAMEGLWQRHCVAAYHERIARGECAIAALFIEGKRWTVELQPAPTKKGICIAQIAGRFNEPAHQRIWAKAHAMLRIRTQKKTSASTQTARRDDRLRSLHVEQLSRVLPVLRRLQIEEVVVTFDGSGDSGTVERPTFVPYRKGVGEEQVVLPRVVLQRCDDRWERVIEDGVYRLDQALVDICNQYTEYTGVDWYNNDGGFGQMIIGVQDGTVSMTINTRFTESQIAFEETVPIEEAGQA